MPSPVRKTAVVLLLLLVASLFAVQLFVFPAMKLDAAARGLPPSARAMVRVLVSPPRPFRLAWPALALFSVAGLVWLDLRHRAIRDLFARATETPRRARWLLVALSVVAARYYLDPGLPHQFDAKLHYAMTADTAHLLGRGALPLYSFDFYGGFPIHHFQGPLLYLLAAVLSAPLGLSTALKLLLFVAHVLSGLATFRLVRKLGGSHRASFLGGLAAVLSFQHTYSTVITGRMPVAFLYVWFPLLLADAETLARRPSLRVGLRAGLLVAAMIWTHPGLAPYGALVAAIWAFVRALSTKERIARLRGLVRPALVAGATAAVLSAGLVAGAMKEASLVQLDGAGPALFFDPDFGHLVSLVRWNMAFTGHALNYVGLSIVAFAAIALFRKDPARLRPAFLAAIAVLAWFVLGPYIPSRSVHFLAIVLAAAAGLLVDRVRRPLLFPLALLLLLDLGATTIQSPYRPDLGYDRAYMREVAARLDGQRALRVSLRDGKYAASEWATPYGSGQPLATGPFFQACPALYPLIVDLVRRVNRDLAKGGPLTPATRFGLRALGVRALTGEDGERPVGIPETGLPVELDPAVTLVPDAGPLLAVVRPDELGAIAGTTWEEVLAGAPAPVADPAATGVRDVAVAAAPDRVSVRFVADRGGTLVTTFGAWPGLRARLDGAEVDTTAAPAGMLALPVAAGRHELVLEYVPPPYLAFGWLVTLLGLILFVPAWCLLRGEVSVVEGAGARSCPPPLRFGEGEGE